MPIELITLDRTLGNKIIDFIKHPITALFLGFLISGSFYLISLSYKSPAYYITNPELIAQITDDKLKIRYDNIELTNVYSSSIIIWNDGNSYIDYDDFIKGKPIKVYSKDSISFLSINTSKKSRKDINFTTKIINDTIKISLSSDEAIEEGDGAKFLVLFTKRGSRIDAPNFHLESRIKGTKDGFVFRDLSNYKTKSDKLSIYILWGIIIFFTLFRIIVLYIYNKPIVFRRIEAVILFSLFIVTIYMTINYIFYSTNLNWL